MALFFLLFILILLYFYIEKKINDRCLATFRAVIHVNGIRGKTSTCRYLDAALRTKYRVFTKTTGTDARIIDTLGTEHPLRRFGPANIHEQLRIIRQARREQAEILILECMAVNPCLQEISQTQIVKSNIGIITNVRYDHIFEMGNSLPEISASLSSTIPRDGILYTADPDAAPFLEEECKAKNCRLQLCLPADGCEGISCNIAIANAVSASLGVTPEEFEQSLLCVKEDFGAKRLYTAINSAGETIRILNLFSVNDPQSTRSNIDEMLSSSQRLCFLYNHREDRPDRAFLFARYFFPYYRECTVYVTGSGKSLACRLFAKAGITDLHRVRNWDDCLAEIPKDTVLVGIGNIKGEGYKMTKHLENMRTMSVSENGGKTI